MQRNKHPARSLTAFLVTWSFLVLTLTGLVLYVVPHGRVAYWVHWSLLGLEKEQWAWVHMVFGGLFIVTGALHLWFNWKPFKRYLADRVRGHLALKREVVVATTITVAVFVVSAFDLPPASWIIGLNERVKASWVTSPELEPPYGHAEESSLAALARRQGIDLDGALGAIRDAGIAFDGPQDSLERIARRNGITPMDVFALMLPHRHPEEPLPEVMTAEAIEARWSGSGLGRKSLSEVCETTRVAPETALQRLAAAGIEAAPDDKLRAVADRSGRSPIDVLKIVLIP